MYLFLCLFISPLLCSVLGSKTIARDWCRGCGHGCPHQPFLCSLSFPPTPSWGWAWLCLQPGFHFHSKPEAAATSAQETKNKTANAKQSSRSQPFLSKNSMNQEVPGGCSLPREGVWNSWGGHHPAALQSHGKCPLEGQECCWGVALKIVRDSHAQALHPSAEVDKSLPLRAVKALTGPSLPHLLIWPKTGVAMGVFQARIWL